MTTFLNGSMDSIIMLKYKNLHGNIWIQEAILLWDAIG